MIAFMEEIRKIYDVFVLPISPDIKHFDFCIHGFTRSHVTEGMCSSFRTGQLYRLIY